MTKITSYCPYCGNKEEIEADEIDETPYDCPKCGRLINHNKTVLSKVFGVIFKDKNKDKKKIEEKR